MQPVFDDWMNSAVDTDGAVFLQGDGHTVPDIVQEFIAQRVDNGHLNFGQPDGSQDGTGGSQGVDGLAEEHAGGLTVHGAGAVQNQTAGGGADGLRQANSFAGQGLAVEIGIVLVTAGGLLVTELQGTPGRKPGC